jgi:dipeptidyl aminopeptidase/acylaminoacyl peptidase
VSVERRERPKAFAALWDRPGTPRPPTTVANPLDGSAPSGTLTADEVAAARGVERSGGIRLSPDGSEVAFAMEMGGALEICSAPVFGDRIIQLTDLGSRCLAPRWSPDGRWVAFAREDSGSRSLWVVDRDGEHAHEVQRGDALHGAVALGADGAPRWGADDASPVLRSAGIAFVDGSASWSPDRSVIAFTTHARGATKIAFAHVRDGKAGPVEVLDSTPFEDSDPVWRPDGRGVVYRRREHGNVTLHRVFTVSHADDAVLDVPGWLFSPQVGPDSETIVAVLVDRQGSHVVVRPKGGITAVRITPSAASG